MPCRHRLACSWRGLLCGSSRDRALRDAADKNTERNSPSLLRLYSSHRRAGGRLRRSQEEPKVSSSAHGMDGPGPGPIPSLLSPRWVVERLSWAARWSSLPSLIMELASLPTSLPLTRSLCLWRHCLLRHLCCESPVKAGPSSRPFSNRLLRWARSWPATDTPASRAASFSAADSAPPPRPPQAPSSNSLA